MKCPQRPPAGSPFKLPESDEWRDDNTCSYCGSLNPEEFMKLAEQGTELDPTDKSYKVYVKHGPHGQQKFYFEHLSVEQRIKFIELFNERKLVIGYPGYFYHLPFFMQMKS